jgi:hypothetical protein
MLSLELHRSFGLVSEHKQRPSREYHVGRTAAWPTLGAMPAVVSEYDVAEGAARSQRWSQRHAHYRRSVVSSALAYAIGTREPTWSAECLVSPLARSR